MSSKNFPEFAEHAANNPLEYIKRYKSEGRKVMGYTCTYVPEEILYAAGYIPTRLLGRAQNIQKADSLLQTYCCSQIRSMAEDFLNDEHAPLDGVIFAHTCDSMQSFHDILKRNMPEIYIQNVNFPSRVDTDIAYKYAVSEVARFKASFEAHIGETVKASALEESVAVYNENRELLSRLYSLHMKHPDKIASATLLHAVMASMILDKKEVNCMLSAYLGTFEDAAPENTSLKRLLLVGSININRGIYDYADEFGSVIANDDMCTGRRYFDTRVTEPTVEGITRRYFDRPHCAAKHRGLHSRDNYILSLVEKQKIDGVIFLYLKFCDPHSFDYPDIRNALTDKGIPTQLFEIEQASASTGQLRTKMQAFMEMLG